MDGTDPMRPEERILASELARQLESALEPDPARLRRARGAVVAAYDAGYRPAMRHAAPPARRWAVALAFATLLVASAGFVAAESGPGQPFYEARLAFGSLLLPGEGAARDRGLASELDDRLTEAQAAARRGDTAGLRAALAAYRRTLDDLTRGGIADPSVLGELQRHQAVLQDLLSATPDAAQPGLQQALQNATKAAGPPATEPPSIAPHATPQTDPKPSGAPSHRPN